MDYCCFHSEPFNCFACLAHAVRLIRTNLIIIQYYITDIQIITTKILEKVCSRFHVSESIKNKIVVFYSVGRGRVSYYYSIASVSTLQKKKIHFADLQNPSILDHATLFPTLKLKNQFWRLRTKCQSGFQSCADHFSRNPRKFQNHNFSFTINSYFFQLHFLDNVQHTRGQTAIGEEGELFLACCPE